MLSRARHSIFALILLLAFSACDCEDGVVSLSGELWVGRTVVEFGRVCIGDVVEIAIPVENRGPIPLNFEDLLVSGGTGADRFGVVSYPETLERAGADGSTGSIVVSFEPQARDLVFTGLFVTTDEIERPDREIELRGEGDDGPRTVVTFHCVSEDGSEITPCPSIMLGEIGVGAMGEQRLILENQGCAVLTATDVSHTFEGGQVDTEIYGFEAPETPFTFSNISAKEMSVSIRPVDEDAYIGRFEVVWEDRQVDASPVTTGINVIGQGVDLQLVVQPSRYTFGAATIDEPQTHTFAIRNLGARSGEVTGIDLRDGLDVFSVDPPELPATVHGLGEIYFDVTYAPLETGQDRDVVLVRTDVGTLEVPVMGGVVPQIFVDPSPAVDFGFVDPGETEVRSVTVANIGQANLVVSDIVFEINPAGVFTFESLPGAFPVIVEPDQDFTFDIVFEDNVTVANEKGQIAIICDDPGYAESGYLLELNTQNEMVLPPDASLTVLVDGVADDRNPVPLETGQTVTFDASASTSHDGSQLTFFWQIIDRPGPATADLSSDSGSVVTLVPDFPGGWRVRVNIQDRFGLTAWESGNLNVSDPD